jgi:hypothetical protein
LRHVGVQRLLAVDGLGDREIERLQEQARDIVKLLTKSTYSPCQILKASSRLIYLGPRCNNHLRIVP